MREQILKILATCPNGTRKRNIFSPANAEGHKALYELEAVAKTRHGNTTKYYVCPNCYTEITQ